MSSPPPSDPQSWNSARPAADLLEGLPGEALLRRGLADARAGRGTIPACQVRIAQRRLSQAGLIAGDSPPPTGEAELELHRRLPGEGDDAYSRCHALLRELVSFESALEHRCQRRNG